MRARGTCAFALLLLSACYDLDGLIRVDASSNDLGVGSMDAATTDAGPPAAPGLTVLAGQPGGGGSLDGPLATARFREPLGVAVAADGTVYVADTGNNAIRKISPAGVVSVLAGDPAHFGEVDGIGRAARFDRPRALVLVADHDLYVVDASNRIIRKVDVTTGEVSHFAGNSQAYATLDGIGIAARFADPCAIAHAGGKLYVTETGGNVVRAIDIASKDVKTIAGSGKYDYLDAPATAAWFRGPCGIAADASSVYVADVNNRVLRQIDLGTLAVTTPLGTQGMIGTQDGTGSIARFGVGLGLHFLGTSLYATDVYGQTVRRIDPAANSVATLAGGAGPSGYVDGIGNSARFFEPVGLAVQGPSLLLVADSKNHLLRGVELPSGKVNLAAGVAPSYGSTDGVGSAARFSLPTGVTPADAGAVLVSDLFNHALRRVELATGQVTTVVGGRATGSVDGPFATASLHRPGALASDGQGRVFVSEPESGTVRMIDLSTSTVTTLAGLAFAYGSTDGTGALARFNAPAGLATDGQGLLYLADEGNHVIRRIVISSGEVTTLAGQAGGPGETDGTGMIARFTYPVALALSGGALYVADQGGATLRRLDLSNNAVSTILGAPMQHGTLDGIGGAARLNQPIALALDGTGGLFVAEYGSSLLRRVELSTLRITTVAGQAGIAAVAPGPLPAGLNRPGGLAVLPGGIVLTAPDENAVLLIH